MRLEKTHKTKTLAYKATEEFHAKVQKFCDKRMWNMSKFLEQATIESLEKVLKQEARLKGKK